MSHLPQAATAQVEYNPRKRRISIDRIFQIPNMFRPTASAFFGNTIGRVNLERPAVGLTAVASWFRFAHWRRQHPVARPADHARRKDRTWLYETVIAKEGLDRTPMDFWEFGVFRGDSLFWWLKNIPNAESRFVGFDTFTGLPERWRATEPEGAFNVYGRLPETNDARCSFEAGLFQDALLPFIARHDFSRRLVINLDADLFSSTLFVLTALARHFKRGDIIFFDNYICSVDEYRAFEDYVKAYRVKYEVLGAVGEYMRVCVKIL
ncbi:MAG: TylF/MycF/NovP-related O-methyltransferase [Candidatus Acidiferrales bacterium]